jgi:hypothetical protein
VERSDLTRAIAAATSVVASLGLPASDAVVLQNSNKLALRLTPCDVFAGVAHMGQEPTRPPGLGGGRRNRRQCAPAGARIPRNLLCHSRSAAVRARRHPAHSGRKGASNLACPCVD